MEQKRRTAEFDLPGRMQLAEHFDREGCWLPNPDPDLRSLPQAAAPGGGG